jgi:hypothetical protein
LFVEEKRLQDSALASVNKMIPLEDLDSFIIFHRSEKGLWEFYTPEEFRESVFHFEGDPHGLLEMA